MVRIFLEVIFMLRNIYYEILKRWNKKNGTLAVYIVVVMLVFGLYIFSGGQEVSHIVNETKQKSVDSTNNPDTNKASSDVKQGNGLNKSDDTANGLEDSSSIINLR
jgi:hypothetical protein